jgi:aspartate aminotransferase-like enzyme
MVFADETALAATDFARVPATFNIAQNIAQREPMYTVASPQLRALRQALRENYIDAAACERRYRHYSNLGAWVRSALREHGIAPLVDGEGAAPVICTFALRCAGAARRCVDAGFHIAYESSYLAQRRWGQISIMGDLSQESVEGVLALLQAPAV